MRKLRLIVWTTQGHEVMHGELTSQLETLSPGLTSHDWLEVKVKGSRHTPGRLTSVPRNGRTADPTPPGGVGCCVLGSEHAQWGAGTLETWAIPREYMLCGMLGS